MKESTLVKVQCKSGKFHNLDTKKTVDVAKVVCTGKFCSSQNRRHLFYQPIFFLKARGLSPLLRLLLIAYSSHALKLVLMEEKMT